MVVAAACGKKGPPLAPFVRVPAAVADVTAAAHRRRRLRVVPGARRPTSTASSRPTSASLEVYAITATSPPETDEQRKLATLVATLPVRPILPALPPAPGRRRRCRRLPLPPGRRSRRCPRSVAGRRSTAETARGRGAAAEARARRAGSSRADEEPVTPGRWWRRPPSRAAAPLLLRGWRQPARAQGAGVDAGGGAARRGELPRRRAPVVTYTETGHDHHLVAVARCALGGVRRAAAVERRRRRGNADARRVTPVLAAAAGRSRSGSSPRPTTYHLFEVPSTAARRGSVRAARAGAR